MKTSKQINAERKEAGLPPLNFALFRKVINKLTVAPAAYEQEDSVILYDDQSPCGTAACLGGWADILSAPSKAELEKRMKSYMFSLDRGGNSLGLGGVNWAEEEGTERAVMFTGDPLKRWPEPYCSQWGKTTTRKGRARVAIRYLTHIIRTGKILE